MENEIRNLKVMLKKSGSGSCSPSISIPKSWYDKLKIVTVGRGEQNVRVTFDGTKIVIEKIDLPMLYNRKEVNKVNILEILRDGLKKPLLLRDFTDEQVADLKKFASQRYKNAIDDMQELIDILSEKNTDGNWSYPEADFEVLCDILLNNDWYFNYDE